MIDLKQIQDKAETMLTERSDNMYLPTTKAILELIANLAARMQEIEKQWIYKFKCDALDLVEMQESILGFKTHRVVVEYCSTIDVNIGIHDAVNEVINRGTGEIDFQRIRSDQARV